MKFGAILFLLSLWFMLSPALYFHMGEREEKCIIEDVPSDTLVMGRYKMQQWDITSHEFHSSAPGLGMVVTIKTPDGKVCEQSYEFLGSPHHLVQESRSAPSSDVTVSISEILNSSSGVLGDTEAATTSTEGDSEESKLRDGACRSNKAQWEIAKPSSSLMISCNRGDSDDSSTPRGEVSWASIVLECFFFCLAFPPITGLGSGRESAAKSISSSGVRSSPSTQRVHLDIQLDEQSLDENIAQAKDKMNEVKIRIQHLRQQIQHISKEQNYQREREEHFRETSEGTNNNILWWAIVQTIILCLVGIWQMKHMKDFLIAKKLV
nr:PREDICTED: transmembrane emp24 domain-containing protein 11-like [Latimeria chalumnae]|eukprot:XP_005994963.2 PREDICTED: transmembrane emp24 domain-containing protein 11-like [Latimeria chalumnae]